MKQEISESEFIDAFDRMNRSNNFTVEGRRALYQYLEEFASDTGEEYTLDVIAICCEFSEYESLKEFQKDYGDEYESLEDIENVTTVIRVDDETFIIIAF